MDSMAAGTAERQITVYAPEMIVAGGDPKGEPSRYYSLMTGDRLMLTEEEAAGSKEWHIAFKRSVIRINGGLAGPGGMTGACVSPPFEGTREAFLALTQADLVRTFHAVANVPAGTVFMPEGVEPAITGWCAGEGGRHVHNDVKCWKLRLADGAGFAKLRFKEVGARLEYAVMQYGFQPARGAAVAPDRTARLEEGKAFSFARGTLVPAEGTGWDIKLAGGKIYLNTSVNGPGGAGAIGSTIWGAKWGTLDPSDSVAYFMDEVGSLFRNPKWYRYNIDGRHNLHPNGAVYLLRAAGADFKLQVYDYFTHKGSDLGNFRLRYARL